jgi:hypothetical protein
MNRPILFGGAGAKMCRRHFNGFGGKFQLGFRKFDA